MDPNLPAKPVEPINPGVDIKENSVLNPVETVEPIVQEKVEQEIPTKHKIIVTTLAFLAVFLLALLVGILSIR